MHPHVWQLVSVCWSVIELWIVCVKYGKRGIHKLSNTIFTSFSVSSDANDSDWRFSSKATSILSLLFSLRSICVMTCGMRLWVILSSGSLLVPWRHSCCSRLTWWTSLMRSFMSSASYSITINKTGSIIVTSRMPSSCGKYADSLIFIRNHKALQSIIIRLQWLNKQSSRLRKSLLVSGKRGGRTEKWPSRKPSISTLLLSIIEEWSFWVTSNQRSIIIRWMTRALLISTTTSSSTRQYLMLELEMAQLLSKLPFACSLNGS